MIHHYTTLHILAAVTCCGKLYPLAFMPVDRPFVTKFLAGLALRQVTLLLDHRLWQVFIVHWLGPAVQIELLDEI
jgi:hypothetical protein